MCRHANLIFVALMLILNAPMVLAADNAASSIVGGNFFASSSGAIGVNASAGNQNQQLNVASVGRNDDAGAVTRVVSEQKVVVPTDGLEVGLASIQGQAFTNAAGLIRINQASGFGNLQANGVTIAVGVGVEVVADVTLLQSRAESELPSGVGKASEAVGTTVSQTAFLGSQGVVQVNQAAGSGNASANTLSLRFQGGAFQ